MFGGHGHAGPKAGTRSVLRRRRTAGENGIRRCTRIDPTLGHRFRRCAVPSRPLSRISVDAESGLAHSLATTAANAADVTQACVLLHGDETEAWGDAGYQGVDKRPENRGCDVAWQVAMKPGKRRLLDRDGAEAAAEKRFDRCGRRWSIPCEAAIGYGKVPTGDWRRTRSASRCCSGSRICHRWPTRSGWAAPGAGPSTTLRAVPSSSISPYPPETSPTDPPYQARGRVPSASRDLPSSRWPV